MASIDRNYVNRYNEHLNAYHPTYGIGIGALARVDAELMCDPFDFDVEDEKTA